VVDGAQAVVDRTTAVVDSSDAVVAQTATTVDRADGLTADASRLLGQLQQPMAQLLPVLERMAATLDPREVDAAVLLIDRLPDLLRSVDEELLPLARTLKDVGPEIHSLLTLAEDLHDTLSKVPGMGLVRRRREAAADADEASEQASTG
jgi:ABC-type transporter Mla subunit MlaD